MASLDENMDIIDQTEVPFLSTAIRYGLIGGGIVTVWTLLSGILGLNEASTTSFILGTVVSIAIYAGIASSAIKHHRNEELGGYITLGRAFQTGLVATIITGIIGGLVAFAYYNFIDPAAIDQIVESSVEMMEGFGLPEEQLEEAAKSTRDGFGFGKLLLNSTIGAAIFGGIISLITGSIMKKEAPMV